jgi:hypothetical protein
MHGPPFTWRGALLPVKSAKKRVGIFVAVKSAEFPSPCIAASLREVELTWDSSDTRTRRCSVWSMGIATDRFGDAGAFKSRDHGDLCIRNS